jgi:hypothetical protein
MKFLTILILLLSFVALAGFVALGFVDINIEQTPLAIDISEKLWAKL